MEILEPKYGKFMNPNIEILEAKYEKQNVLYFQTVGIIGEDLFEGYHVISTHRGEIE